MTPDQKRLVENSWKKILPMQDKAAELFYTRLFAQYPEVQPYFKGDMHEQGRKLMVMIGTAVNALEDLNSLRQALKQMGAQHGAYGVRDDDYDKVGAALLWTLEQGLGSSFTSEVRQAWAITYAEVSALMKTAAAAGNGG